MSLCFDYSFLGWMVCTNYIFRELGDNCVTQGKYGSLDWVSNLTTADFGLLGLHNNVSQFFIINTCISPIGSVSLGNLD